MSIIIKGMEMPKNCGTCPLRRGDCSQRIYMEKRPDNCPLVPVPPHGRLIDADEMRDEWLINGENEYVYDTNAFLESIDNQPTVIPAEFGGAESK